MNSTHRVNVVRITDIRKHPNADSLSIVKIGGYQCVVRTQDFKEGDLAYYVQPDSILPDRPEYAFMWEGKRQPDGEVKAKHRRVKAKKLRGEWSEGLLMPISDYTITNDEGRTLVVTDGADVSSFLGIAHYEPEEPAETQQTHNYDRGVRPRSLKGWFYWLLRKMGFDLNGPTGGDNPRAPECFPPVYDVEALKNYKDVFQEDEMVVVTEKIHGSNARFVFENGKMYAGSRRLWKAEGSSTIWRKCLEQHPWIEVWCQNHTQHTLYGEVVPTQKGYDYGCEPGQVKFFLFDVRKPDGSWASSRELSELFFDFDLTAVDDVPLIFRGSYDPKIVLPLADGPSCVLDAKHRREGIVIRPVVEREARGLGRVQLKVVSNEFLNEQKD